MNFRTFNQLGSVLSEEGLFRIPGNKLLVDGLREQFLNGKTNFTMPPHTRLNPCLYENLYILFYALFLFSGDPFS